MQTELTLAHVDRDITTIPVDAIVNPWNRNFVPRWLLMPGGVSAALKRKTGPEPWQELARHGMLDLVRPSPHPRAPFPRPRPSSTSRG